MICWWCSNIYFIGNDTYKCKIDGHEVPSEVYGSKKQWTECPLNKVGWIERGPKEENQEV